MNLVPPLPILFFFPLVREGSDSFSPSCGPPPFFLSIVPLFASTASYLRDRAFFPQAGHLFVCLQDAYFSMAVSPPLFWRRHLCSAPELLALQASPLPLCRREDGPPEQMSLCFSPPPAPFSAILARPEASKGLLDSSTFFLSLRLSLLILCCLHSVEAPPPSHGRLLRTTIKETPAS